MLTLVCLTDSEAAKCPWRRWLDATCKTLLQSVWWAGDWLKAVPNCLLKDNDLMRLSTAIKTWYLVDYFMDIRLYMIRCLIGVCVCAPLRTVDIGYVVYPWNTVLPWVMAFVTVSTSIGPVLQLLVRVYVMSHCFCNFGCVARDEMTCHVQCAMDPSSMQWRLCISACLCSIVRLNL